MHTLAIECDDRVYEHIKYFLSHLPHEDVTIWDDENKKPNEETKQAIEELEAGGGEVCQNADELFDKLGI